MRLAVAIAVNKKQLWPWLASSSSRSHSRQISRYDASYTAGYCRLVDVRRYSPSSCYHGRTFFPGRDRRYGTWRARAYNGDQGAQTLVRERSPLKVIYLLVQVACQLLYNRVMIFIAIIGRST